MVNEEVDIDKIEKKREYRRSYYAKNKKRILAYQRNYYYKKKYLNYKPIRKNIKADMPVKCLKRIYGNFTINFD